MDLARTLEDLDGERWGDADADATTLIRECHRLRRVAVGDLSSGDLRLLLGQQIGVEWLVPLALDQLRGEPLAGDLYPGDLLNAVLAVGPAHWEAHPNDRLSLSAVRDAPERIRTDVAAFLDRDDWPVLG